MSGLRPYQLEAVNACYQFLREKDGNPLVVLPTGAGKSWILAQIAADVVNLWGGRILILCHVQELIEQNAEKIRCIAPDFPVGLYSAGLGYRDTLPSVICGSIQSTYRKARELGRFDILVVDEAHCLGPDADSMYQRIFCELREINPALRIVGTTATPYRLSSGSLCGPGNLFDEICYEIGVRELIVQGYLCPLISKAGSEKPDTDLLHVRGGEYVASEVEALMDESRLVESACREILEYTKDRRACLIFASGIKHGQHIADTLTQLGQRVATIFGETLDFERELRLSEFKAGKLKYLVNVNVLTTGVDAPIIDSIALLRPTLSPGLYYQQVGRGFRLHPSKKNCLVLDFGGNVMRHGPVDAIRIRQAGSSSGNAPAKECPKCHSVIAAGYSVCPDCGFEFPRRASQHEAKATSEGILSGQVTEIRYVVQDVQYYVHAKRNAPPNAPRSMRVEYKLGWQQYQSEWICFEHTGFARQRAESWWKQRTCEPVPDSADEAVGLAESGMLSTPRAIVVRSVAGEEFNRIVGYEMGERPNTSVEPEYVPAEDDLPF